MNQSSLATLATRLAAHLDCTQDVACRQIMQAMVETGQPLSLIHLARRLQMSQEKLAAHLARVPDTEFDEQGNIVGWGITLLPTQHQFRLKELPLFTWCAFDTVLFPPLLQVEAHVQSICEATDQPITFVATPEGIADLLPATSVLSLILPTARCDCVRGTFCEQSLFFQSEEAASSWMALHPDAVLLSVEEAAVLGQMVAKMWPHESAA
ncbi:MAG TPA: organomercurial lyase [Ktedonobacteraceae bacterium]|nr:organomercurial lyase [Ktedonobacteraceae bacterium]